MGTEVYAGNIGDIQLAGASKGVALTTAAAFTGFPEGTHWISMTPRNFATAVVARFLLSPYLLIFKTTDSLIAATNYTDLSSAAQDADAGTDVVLSSLDTLANGDAMFVGSHIPFAGAHLTVDSANTNTNDLTVDYWDGSAWSDISDTDNTDTGASLAVTGTVTWTVPSDWATARLVDVVYTLTDGTGTATDSPVPMLLGANAIAVTGAGTFTIVLPTGATGFAVSDVATVTDSPKALVAGSQTITVTGTGNVNVVISRLDPHSLHLGTPDIYWTRWEWSATLDSPTTLDQILAINRLTNYAELGAGQHIETTVDFGPGGISGVEALTDAGTANLIVNVATRSSSRKFA